VIARRLAPPLAGVPAGRLFSAGRAEETCQGKELPVLLIVAILLLALILAGVGFAVHVLWWIALIVLAVWLLGFLFRAADGGGRRRRWYRW
jgi:hypothetical protein